MSRISRTPTTHRRLRGRRRARRLAPAAALLAVPALLAALVACTDSRAPTAAREAERPAAELAQAGAGAGGVGTAGTIPLPIDQSVSSSTPAFRITQTGTGSNGGFFIFNTSNVSAALAAYTTGVGPAGSFQIGNSSNANSALYAKTGGTGNALLVDQAGSCTSSSTACNMAIFRSGGANKIRFNKAGKGFFNGGTQTGGADVAEAFAVEGTPRAYEPGDVLAISERGDRRPDVRCGSYSYTLVEGAPRLVALSQH